MGALIEGLHPLGPVFHGAGLNITVMSNNGRVGVGLIACRESMPDVDDLAQRFPAELARLRRRSGGRRPPRSPRTPRRSGPPRRQRQGRGLTSAALPATEVPPAGVDGGARPRRRPARRSRSQRAGGVTGVDVVDGGAGDGAGHGELRAGAITWSWRLTTTAVGTSIWPSHGREWCRPSAAMAWATAHGAGGAELRERPVLDVDGLEVEGAWPRLATACTAVRERETVRSPSIAAPCGVKKNRSARFIWNRSVVAQSTSPPILSACWRHTRCATIEPIE